MKSIRHLSYGLLVPALIVAALAPVPAAAQDKSKAAPAAASEKAKAPAAAADKSKAPEGTTKVIVENDKVRVAEVRYKPGEGSAVRERKARVTRALTDGTMERTYADGKKEKVTWKAGETRYFPKETFANKNVGKAEMVLYVVTLK